MEDIQWVCWLSELKMGVSDTDQYKRRKSKALLIKPLPLVLAAVVDPLKLHILYLFPAISLMLLVNDKLFAELIYALLKDFLGKGDGLRIGQEGY